MGRFLLLFLLGFLFVLYGNHYLLGRSRRNVHARGRYWHLNAFGTERVTEVYQRRFLVLQGFGLLRRIVRLDSFGDSLLALFFLFGRQSIDLIPRSDAQWPVYSAV